MLRPIDCLICCVDSFSRLAALQLKVWPDSVLGGILERSGEPFEVNGFGSVHSCSFADLLRPVLVV